VSITQGTDRRTTFVYDGKRRRRVTREETKGSSGQWVLASETRYVYDGMRVIQERTSNGVPTVAYTRGPDLSGTLEGAGGIGGLLARSEWNSVSSTWSHAFYHSDGVGNVTALAVPSGNDIALAGSYRYDPFGRLIGTPTDLAARNTQRFSSKDWHNPSEFYYFGYRFYDPATQRWLNRDPIGEDGGVNLYGYVGNNPVNFYDPYGFAIGDWWDARTWFNSGFTESWSDSANSIGEALGDALAGNWGGVEDAYDSGVLGQTKDADPFTKYGTRVCIGTAAAAVSAAVALEAAGVSTRIAAHGAHHSFGPLGRLPHAQLNWWRAGVKGSGGAVRIPVPPGTPGFPP
jgi:RHS repeat-associated protein